MKKKKLNKVFAGGLLSVAAAVFLIAAVPAFGAGSIQSGSSDVISASQQSEGAEESPAVTSEPAQSPEPYRASAEPDASVTDTPAPEDSGEGEAPAVPAPDNSVFPSEQGLTDTENDVQTLDWAPGWNLVNGKYYYYLDDGTMVRGQWLKDGNDWYYLNDDGTMKSGEWFKDGIDWYYLRDWGGMMYNQFFTYKGNTYYFRSWGGMMYSGRFQVNGKWYTADSSGVVYSEGWTLIDGKYYYMQADGTIYRQEGWLNLNGKYYYINADGSRVQGQWLKDGIDWYYLNDDGTMKSAEWFQEGNDWYYLREWGGAMHDMLFYDGENTYYFESDCRMARGWYQIGGYTYYFRDWGAAMNTAWVIDGVHYVFDSQGHLVETQMDAQVGVRTIKNFLKNALLPVGNTLYIWGGGHDDADASRYGVNPQWKSFFDSQDEDYNYTQHRYEYGNGLDCSGYVGWAAHQVMQTWATTTSTITPKYYYEKGWGSYVENDTSMKFQTGDVVSMSGHVWIVLGQCSDGSIVILHASPKYVQISGSVSSSGSTNSEAIQLAEQYMSRYYPVAYGRYGCKVASRSYMTGVNHFTWSSSVLSDPDGYRNMSPAQILADLFGE